MSLDTVNVPWMDQFREMTAGITFCKPRTVQAGLIYFIEAEGSGMVKIGTCEKNPQARLLALQTGCPHPLRLLFSLRGGLKTERELQDRFRHLRVRGEWFKMEGELLDFITTMTQEERRAA